MASSFCGCSMRMAARRSFRGNGTRCVAAWLARAKGCTEVALGTHGGVRTCRVIEATARSYLIESEMGVPRVMPRTIEVAGVGDVAGAMVNVGNPHFVMFVESGGLQRAWDELAGAGREDQRRVRCFRMGRMWSLCGCWSADEIAFRIYERGCGPTTSSGTGTCASSAAAMALRGVARELDGDCGGRCAADGVAGDDAEMLLTGPAEIICRGEVAGAVQLRDAAW